MSRDATRVRTRLKKLVHLNETDPVKLAGARAVMDVLFAILEGTKPALYAALGRRELFLLALYDGDENRAEIFIEKYAPDASVVYRQAAHVTGVGPCVALVLKPLPDRGTVNEILKRQTGEDYPDEIH